ncbi:condensation domain-containing protein [Micromonospora sp. NPDC003197]
MNTSAPLTFGQLAIVRDIESIPTDRWHEPNLVDRWVLPAGLGMAQVRAAVTALVRRHESLRTTYDLDDRRRPTQSAHPATEPVLQVERATGEDELAALVQRCARTPFDLGREPPWRATVVTSGGTPTHLVVVNHHIVADGLGVTTLRRDFFAALAGRLADTITGPRDVLAREQSPAGRRQGAAAIDYWTKLLPEASPPEVGEPPLTQATLVSQSLLRAAAQVATQLRTTVATVALAAYCAGLLEMSGGDRMTVRLMSANRFDPYRRDVVTSMNQWVPFLAEAVPEPDLPGRVRQVAARTRVAYAHGVYDVDRAFALLDQAGYRPGQYDSTWSFNFVARNPEVSDPERPNPPDGDRITWEPPFSSVGPRRYLRVVQADALHLVVRVPAAQATVATELIYRMVHTLSERAGSAER